MHAAASRASAGARRGRARAGTCPRGARLRAPASANWGTSQALWIERRQFARTLSLESASMSSACRRRRQDVRGLCRARPSAQLAHDARVRRHAAELVVDEAFELLLNSTSHDVVVMVRIARLRSWEFWRAIAGDGLESFDSWGLRGAV